MNLLHISSLIVIYSCLTLSITQGRTLHKKHKKTSSKVSSKHYKNVRKSALEAIHPEDLAPHPDKPKDVSASRKSFGEVNLQTMEESQRMNALSSRLSHNSPGEDRLINGFLKDMERSHGQLTPSVMRKVARIGGYQPMYNTYQPMRKIVNLSGSQRSVNPPHPTLARNPSALSFDLGGRKVISNTESDMGVENPGYKSDPMPEYNYRELKYNLPTTSDGGYRRNSYDDALLDNNHDDEYDDKDYSDERNGKGYLGNENYSNGDQGDERSNAYHSDYSHSNGGHGDERSNGYHGDDSHSNGDHSDKEDYNREFDNHFGLVPDSSYQDEASNAGVDSMLGKKGENLINEIGRKVLSNIIQRQQNTEDYHGEKRPELLGAAYDTADDSKMTYDGEMTDSLPSHQGKVMQNSLPSNQRIILNNLAKLLASSKQPSSAKQKISQVLEHFGLTDTQVTQEPQLPLANDLNSKSSDDQTTSPKNIDIGGKMNDVIDIAKATPSIITIPTSKSTSGVTMTTSSGLQRKMQTQNDQSSDSDDVILKISDKGKPVSIKADTSSDGSLLLKIPKKFSEKIIESNGNQATDNDNEADKSPSLDSDVSKLLVGDLGKGSLFGNYEPQISDWEILGKQNKGSKKKKVLQVDSHPTTRLSLPSLSSTLNKDGQPNPKHNINKNLVHAPSSTLPSTAGPSVQQDLGNIVDTPQSLVQSVFPGLAGLPPGARNMEQLMTLLTRMDQLPSSHVPGTVAAFGGHIPTNYAVRHEVQGQQTLMPSYSMKGVLKTSHLAEDSGVVRNKGVLTHNNAEKDWSPCTVTCGKGIQARARPCPEKNCSGFTTESRPCNAGPCPEEIAKAGLKLHNTFRVWHHSAALKWSPSLAKKAQKLADDLALNNDSSMVSADMTELPGENIAVTNSDYNTAAETATRQWYSEVKSYNFAHPTMTDENRHFTQIVWKGTKKAGIGISRSKISNGVYVVALYDPPGNIERQGLRKNVKMPDTTMT